MAERIADEAAFRQALRLQPVIAREGDLEELELFRLGDELEGAAGDKRIGADDHRIRVPYQRLSLFHGIGGEPQADLPIARQASFQMIEIVGAALAEQGKFHERLSGQSAR